MYNNLGKIKLVLTVIFFLSFYLIKAQCPTAACTPTGFNNTQNGRGIFNITLGTLNNTSLSALAEGIYIDNSCTLGTSLTENTSYPISVTTGASSLEKLRIWVDFNDDGAFNTSTELLFSSDALQNHSGNVFIPSSSVKNIPLRMRVAADGNFGSPFPCVNSFISQQEDYFLTVLPDTSPPVSDFIASNTSICGGGASFVNNSTSNQTMTYVWDFGDGDTSHLENPSHTYLTTGSFTVTLIATSVNGSDTLIRTNYITNNNSLLSAANCLPSIATSAGIGFAAGIFNFTLNTINNTTGGDVDGYVDYSCTEKTSLVVGTPYSISITNGINVAERARVWVDLNNDGIFTNGELLFSQDTGKIHNGTLTIPSGATIGTELRLRVACDYNGAAIPTACSTPVYSQTEDYSVTLSVNTSLPVADFEANNLIICDGTVSFSDLSINAPSGWKWYFGDGDSSSIQNPTHTYINTGTYTVTLITTNNIGSDNEIKTNYITFHDTIPTGACVPITNNYCCNYGIYNVTFNTINNTTADGANGYEDHTCKIRTRVTEGFSYPISITTGSGNNHTTKVWIDLNNNGIFEDSTELLLTALNQINASGNIIIPSGAVLNTPLRMRVISDYAASSFTSCFNITNGQAEDYTIFIEPNAIPPSSNFTVDKIFSCDSTFAFTELALNSPDTYLWKFGDGMTSTLENPIHKYLIPNTYTVTLIVSNANGSDTLIKTNYITFSPSPAIDCTPATAAYCCQAGIRKVILNTIDNASMDGFVGYENFACELITTVKAGESTSIFVATSSLISEHVVVWIDLNDDGEFDNNTELVYYDLGTLNHFDSIRVPREAVYNKTLRMRVTSDKGTSAVPSPCGNVLSGQHEDYGIIITEPDSLPDGIISVLSDSDINFYPNPVKNILHFETDLEIKAFSFKNQVGQEISVNYSKSSKNINLENLPNGLYFISIQTNKGILNKKIIVNGK